MTVILSRRARRYLHPHPTQSISAQEAQARASVKLPVKDLLEAAPRLWIVWEKKPVQKVALKRALDALVWISCSAALVGSLWLAMAIGWTARDNAAHVVRWVAGALWRYVAAIWAQF